MALQHSTNDLVHRMSVVASEASDLFVPRPVRAVVDRWFVDAACHTGGGVLGVADRMQVDPPAVDAWRTIGVPPSLRPRLAAIIVQPSPPADRAAA